MWFYCRGYCPCYEIKPHIAGWSEPGARQFSFVFLDVLMMQIFSRFRLLVLMSLSLGAFVVHSVALATSYEDSIAKRLAPVDDVCVKGEECAAALQVAAAGPRSGEEVYNTFCLACHASGAAGAPKFRDAADWSARLGKGLETLYANSINGINAMPAKGLCGNCSDEEIQAAVNHMIEGL